MSWCRPTISKKFTDFITNGIVARRSVVEKDKDTVIRVIKVTAEAIKIIQRDKEYTKKVIMKWMPMKDAGLARAGLSLRRGKLCERRT